MANRSIEFDMGWVKKNILYSTSTAPRKVRKKVSYLLLLIIILIIIISSRYFIENNNIY